MAAFNYLVALCLILSVSHSVSAYKLTPAQQLTVAQACGIPVAMSLVGPATNCYNAMIKASTKGCPMPCKRLLRSIPNRKCYLAAQSVTPNAVRTKTSKLCALPAKLKAPAGK